MVVPCGVSVVSPAGEPTVSTSGVSGSCSPWALALGSSAGKPCGGVAGVAPLATLAGAGAGPVVIGTAGIVAPP